jgi:hypothetical protein
LILVASSLLSSLSSLLLWGPQRAFLFAALAAGLCWLPPRAAAQYYHVGILQGVALPQHGLDVNTPSFNWFPTLTVHYIPKKNPIVLGGSLSLQFFDRTDEGKHGESMELLALPLSFCFQYLLLPEPPFRPYYGIETGVAWYRYRFFDKTEQIGQDNNFALVVTPNAGLKIELVENMDLDLNIRYQWAFHDRLEWGNAQATQGYSILAVSLGLNYQMFRQP